MQLLMPVLVVLISHLAHQAYQSFVERFCQSIGSWIVDLGESPFYLVLLSKPRDFETL
jgi:hypothetical protein